MVFVITFPMKYLEVNIRYIFNAKLLNKKSYAQKSCVQFKNKECFIRQRMCSTHTKMTVTIELFLCAASK